MTSVENNCIVQVEYGLCNGANKTWDVRIHVQALFNKHSQITGRVKQQQTDIDEARQRGR